MTAIIPTEGKVVRARMIYKRDLTDRDADLELALFTNVSPGPSITEATLTEPTGTGYARIALADADWVDNGDGTIDIASKVFTAGTGGWSGDVQGYAVITNAAGGTKRILAIEVDPDGPYTLSENDTYTVDLQAQE